MYFKLAWRNIWRNKRRTCITISAISFAVICSIFMQSINRGSHEVMIDNMVRFHTGHLQLQDYRYKDESSLDNSFYFNEELESQLSAADERIQMLFGRIETFMLGGNEHSTRGALVLGIRPEIENQFNRIVEHLVEGSFFTDDETGVVVGEGLAQRLELNLGDELLLMGQGRFGMSANALYPIVGIIQHPLRDMNDQIVYLPLKEAQDLLSAPSHVTKVLVALETDRHTPLVAQSLSRSLESEDLVVYRWPELLPELLQLLEFDLVGAYFLSAVLYIVIAFGFFGTILTMTLERLREFGVLLSVGLQRGGLGLILFIEILLMSLLGVTLGMTLTWLILLYFYYNPIELTGEMAETVIEMGWEPILPMSFAPDQFYTQGLIVFLISVSVALFPLMKIKRLNILEASRR